METLRDTLQQLSPFFGVLIAFLMWMQYRTQVRLREKDVVLESVQNQQIKTQAAADEAKARADQQKAQIEIIKEFATGMGKNQETWQATLNTMSERRLEGDREIASGLREIATTNRDNMKAIEGIASIIEIHTNAYGNLKTKVEDSLQSFVTSYAATHKAVESQKADLQLLIKANDTLTTRLEELITLDENHVLDEGERHKSVKLDNSEHKTELVGIKNELQTSNRILEKILKRMESNDESSSTVIPDDTPPLQKSA